MGKIKRWWRRCHLWLALSAAVPVLVLAITGALLVFPKSLHSWTSGVPRTVAPLPERLSYTELVACLQQALPADDQPTRLDFGLSANEVVTASSTQGYELAIDPYRGTILQASQQWSLTRWLTWLHVTLALGNWGSFVVGLSALALAALAVSGLVLWWPVGRWQWHYFSVNVRQGRHRLNFDLHRIGGFYAAAGLLVITLSGAAMAFPKPAAAIIYGCTFSSKSTSPARTEIAYEPNPSVDPDRAVAIAQAEFPGWQLLRLYVPVPKSPYYRVFLNPPSSFRVRHQEARLEIHPLTGAIFREDSPRTRSRGDAVLMWMLPLHFGTWGGIGMQFLYLFFSLSPVLLLITGCQLVWKRWRQQRRARQATTTQPES